LRIVRDGRETPIDQHVHGHDFWQVDQDPTAGSWERTYNLPLDTLGEAGRAVLLQLVRTPGP